MLNKEHLKQINEYLSCLACGVENNGLTKEQEKEVLNLGCRCLDEIDRLEAEERANEIYCGKR